MRLILPDVVVFLASLFCMMTSKSRVAAANILRTTVNQNESTNYVAEILPVFVGLMLLLAGIVQPNVLTSVYFMAFLLLGICWGFHLLDYLKKNQSFTIVKLFLTSYAGLHILTLYLYQFPSLQEAITPDGFVSRYIISIIRILLFFNCY